MKEFIGLYDISDEDFSVDKILEDIHKKIDKNGKQD